MSVYRVFVEKRNGFDLEAERLTSDLKDFFGNQYASLAEMQKIRILHRYDVSGLSEEQFNKAVKQVFSEPCSDHVYFNDDVLKTANSAVFGV